MTFYKIDYMEKPLFQFSAVLHNRIKRTRTATKINFLLASTLYYLLLINVLMEDDVILNGICI